MLSASSKHALRALLYLADQNGEQYTSIESVASQTNTPTAYLAKILRKLSSGGVLEIKRGVHGGVRLGAQTISFFDVCQALEDPVLTDRCLLSNGACSRKTPCALHESWKKEREGIKRFLKQSKIR